MANYTIIGGDGKEYGPVTETDIRQWIAEGRLNAQSSAKGEGDAEFRALGLYPEFASVLAPGKSSPVPTAEGGGVTETNDGDYDLDIGACVSRAWAVFKGNMGILIGVVLLFGLMFFAFYAVIGMFAVKPGSAAWPAEVASMILQTVLGALVVGPLTGGLYYLILRAIRGESPVVGDMFAGFEKAFARLYLGQLAVMLISTLFSLPGTLMFFAKFGPEMQKFQQAAESGQTQTPEQMQAFFHDMMQALQSCGTVMLVCLIPAIYLQVSLGFTLPLIMDRKMQVGTALKTSWQMTHRHWWHVFGLFIVSGLITLVGLLACCVGGLFTVPLGMLVVLVAYESIFLRKKA